MAKRIKEVRYDLEDLRVTLSNGEELQIVTWDAPGVKGGMDFVIHHIATNGATTHFESPTEGSPKIGPVSKAELEKAHRRIQHTLKDLEASAVDLRRQIEERVEHMQTIATLGQEKIALMIQVEMLKTGQKELADSQRNEQNMRSAMERILCRMEHLKRAIHQSFMGITPSPSCCECDRCGGDPLF